MRAQLVALAPLVIAVAATAQPEPDTTWARFRGPAGQGIATAPGLPAAMRAEHEVWRARLPGTGHGSPVVWREQVFVATCSASGKERALLALDATTGDERWRRTIAFAPAKGHRLNDAAASTPAVDADAVYLLWADGAEVSVHAFDHAGEPLWRTPVGAFAAQHGHGASPIVCGDVIVVPHEHEGEDCAVVGLDRRTGKELWRLSRDTADRAGAYVTPAELLRAGQTPLVLLASTAHGLTAVDATSGDTAWRADLGLSARCVGTPAVAGELVLLSAGTGGGGKECAVVRMPAKAVGGDDEPAVAEVAYAPRRNLPYVPSALALDGRFYLFTDGGVATCLRADDGESLWRTRLDGPVFSSPVSDGRTVWVADRDGVLYGFAAGETEQRTTRLELGEAVFATPAIAHDRLYVRTAGHLVCLGAKQS